MATISLSPIFSFPFCVLLIRSVCNIARYIKRERKREREYCSWTSGLIVLLSGVVFRSAPVAFEHRGKEKKMRVLSNEIGEHGGCTITYVVTMRFYIIHGTYYMDPILTAPVVLPLPVSSSPRKTHFTIISPALFSGSSETFNS